MSIQVSVMGGEPMQLPEGTTLLELSKSYAGQFASPILLAKVDNALQELFVPLTRDCNVTFVDISDPNGFRTYQRTAVFLMLTAAQEVLGKDVRIVVEHAINKNYFCEIASEGFDVTDDLLAQLESAMTRLAEVDTPIEKHALPLEQAIAIMEAQHMHDKANMLRYRPTSNVNFYKVGEFYDYFYGPMAPHLGYVSAFKLHKSGNGFMLQFPSSLNPLTFLELKSIENISKIFRESAQWARILKIDTVGSLNSIICQSGIQDVMRICEALHEKKIASIADSICEQGKTLVLIAGPSSSGKTTFAKRLCIQLRVNGMRPHLISLDDYYGDRDKSPKDAFGNPDFECLEAIDVPQINKDLQRLMEGETVEIPHFNFVTGTREYKGRTITLAPGDVIVMEGIHGLNDKVSERIAKKDKFKIFISALTQLNLDDHNHISTTDTRLLRRIVRDHRHRGTDSADTIGMWPSVLHGESAYIFPYQNQADALFNSAMIYEMCVIKQYAEALLYRIPRSHGQYTEAQRLIKFLDSFLGASSEQVPSNSILREFIGGSCFES